jgi:hypothetical protein
MRLPGCLLQAPSAAAVEAAVQYQQQYSLNGSSRVSALMGDEHTAKTSALLARHPTPHPPNLRPPTLTQTLCAAVAAPVAAA